MGSGSLLQHPYMPPPPFACSGEIADWCFAEMSGGERRCGQPAVMHISPANAVAWSNLPSVRDCHVVRELVLVLCRNDDLELKVRRDAMTFKEHVYELVKHIGWAIESNAANRRTTMLDIAAIAVRAVEDHDLDVSGKVLR